MYSDRYTGSSNNVDGGGVTGGGGIELVKLFSHNGVLRVAPRPIRRLIAAFFLQLVTLVPRRAATHKGERVEIDSCRYFFFVRFHLAHFNDPLFRCCSNGIPAGLGSRGHGKPSNAAATASGSAGGAGYTGSSGKQTSWIHSLVIRSGAINCLSTSTLVLNVECVMLTVKLALQVPLKVGMPRQTPSSPSSHWGPTMGPMADGQAPEMRLAVRQAALCRLVIHILPSFAIVDARWLS